MCKLRFVCILRIRCQQKCDFVVTDIKLAQFLIKVVWTLHLHVTLPHTSKSIPDPTSTTLMVAGIANWSLRVNSEKWRPSHPSIPTSYRCNRRRSESVGLI